ncbi:MAG: hypothetical protein RBS43_05320 [Candidatus Cloacimonas sp.]|jgi:hypothetical protein|nr:hypothetical protein [Candidatus Cloacimonas sp.]
MNKGGFSWKRLLGISAIKTKVGKTIGIPLTKSGRYQKIGRVIVTSFVNMIGLRKKQS